MTLQTKREQQIRMVVATGAIMVVACLLVPLLLLYVQGGGIGGPAAGLGTRVCAGVSTTPKLQFGMAWTAPISSYAPPLMFSRYKVCLNLPPALSPRAINGEVMFPP